MKNLNILICLFMLILSGCGKKTQQAPAIPVVPVKVETAVLQKFNDSETYVGMLKSRQAVDLYPELTGKVQNIYVKSGDKVAKGSLLITLKADEEQAAVNAQIALAQSKNQNVYSKKARLAEAKAALDFAKSQYERQKKLHAQDLISKNQLETYQSNLEKAQNVYQSIAHEISGSQDEYTKSKLEINEKQARLNKLKVIAPFAGTIQDIPAKIGDLVLPQIKLLSLANVDNLEVYINIPARRLLALKIGSLVEILNEEEQVIGQGNISFIGSTADPALQSVLVKCSLDNSKHQFIDNQQVKTRINYQEKNALLVPLTAVSRFGDTSFVFVVNSNNTINQKAVKLGSIYNGKYEVLEGLQSGEIYVTEGIQKLFEGSKVKIEGASE